MPIDPSFPTSYVHRAASLLATLSDEELEAIRYDWDLWALPHQVEPDWDGEGVSTLLAIGGRGSGKTYGAVQSVRKAVYRGVMRFAFVGPTASHIRDAMVRGEGGILSAFPPGEEPEYIASQSLVRFHTGATAVLLSAEKPQKLRGNPAEFWWVDEFSVCREPEEVWTQMSLSARVGEPRKYVTTNPWPECPFLERLVDEAKERRIKVVKSSSFSNLNNLPEEMRATIRELAKTSKGKAEIYGEFWRPEGCLWKDEHIRYRPCPEQGRTRVIVGVDPTAGGTDEAGIVVAARVGGVGYILDDLSGRMEAGGKDGWVAKSVEAARTYRAHAIYVERNTGWDLLKPLYEPWKPPCPVKEDDTRKSKLDRALPVHQFYELEKVFHHRVFRQLEEQMKSWDPNALAEAKAAGRRRLAKSPDRLDAAVMALSNLGLHLGVAKFTPLSEPIFPNNDW